MPHKPADKSTYQRNQKRLEQNDRRDVVPRCSQGSHDGNVLLALVHAVVNANQNADRADNDHQTGQCQQRPAKRTDKHP